MVYLEGGREKINNSQKIFLALFLSQFVYWVSRTPILCSEWQTPGGTFFASCLPDSDNDIFEDNKMVMK